MNTMYPIEAFIIKQAFGSFTQNQPLSQVHAPWSFTKKKLSQGSQGKLSRFFQELKLLVFGRISRNVPFANLDFMQQLEIDS